MHMKECGTDRNRETRGLEIGTAEKENDRPDLGRMAVLHFIDPPIHPGSGSRGTYSHLKSAINYILKPEKTLGGLYTGSCNCRCETALKEMIDTKNNMERNQFRDKGI